MTSARAAAVRRSPAVGATATDTTAPAAPRSAADAAPSLPPTRSGSRIHRSRGSVPDQGDRHADPPDHPDHRRVVVQADAGPSNPDDQQDADDHAADAGPARREAVAAGGDPEGEGLQAEDEQAQIEGEV